MAFRGPKVWLWRWRRNPLKRRADAVESWIVLGAWLITVLAGVLVGLTATRSVENELAQERAEWKPVVALVTQDAPGLSPANSGRTNSELVWAKVRWTAVDGSSHTGQIRVPSGSGIGTPVTIWTDPQGHLVTKPASVSQAQLRAALIGTLLGMGAAAVPFISARALRIRLERRRMDQWDEEWARFGPLWSRKTG
ncbi:Rv1733c family protein [Streptomyces sp. NPDC002276]